MDLVNFAQDYAEISASEKVLFSDSISTLFKEGFLWRDEEADRKTFNFILRNKILIDDYLAVAGWTVVYHERLGILQLVHKEGAHRRRLNKEQTIWLLLLRMIYAEKREQQGLALTRHPVCRAGELVERYTAFIPGKTLRKKSSLEETLKFFLTLKILRPAGSRYFGGFDPNELIELLPGIEVVLPASRLAELKQRLQEVLSHDDVE